MTNSKTTPPIRSCTSSKPTRAHRSALPILGALLCGTAAFADNGNYQNFIIGERAQGMGGAIGATASGLDACYYNPAGLARVSFNTLSLSANLYGFQKYRAENGLAVGEDLKRNSFVSIPAAVTGITKTEGFGTWAFSAFIPDHTSFIEITSFLDKKHFYAFSANDETLWVGPSVGFAVSDKLLLGASVFGIYQTYSQFESVALGDREFSFSDDLKYNSFGLLAQLGVQYKLDPEWNMGLLLQSPSWGLFGSGTYSATEVMASSGSAGLYGDNLDTGNYIPAKVTANLGWEKPKDRALGLGLTYHLPCSFNMVSGELHGVGIPDTTDSSHLSRAAVVDVSVGGEYYVNGKYPVRMGFFTSRSTASDVNPGSRGTEVQVPQINKYGITTSVGRETKNMSANVGLIYVFGAGDAYGWTLNDVGDIVPQRVPATEQHLYLFLSTSFFF